MRRVFRNVLFDVFIDRRQSSILSQTPAVMKTRSRLGTVGGISLATADEPAQIFSSKFASMRERRCRTCPLTVIHCSEPRKGEHLRGIPSRIDPACSRAGLLPFIPLENVISDGCLVSGVCHSLPLKARSVSV